ncbi:MAG: class I SAM-dependent methyltransferase [Elusimicrobia bacterium]|nr:class I SAM-dependent methyltransferase [Elusimicrobiota bacterium]
MEPALYDLFYDIEEEHWWWRSRRTIALVALERLIPGPERARVLDIGCGMGAFLRALPARFEGYGVDISEKAIEGCRAKGMTRVFQTKGPELPFGPGFFDAACAFDVLEHLDDEGPLLVEAARVLKAGGRLLATVPAFPFLATRWDELNEHKRRYLKDGLIGVLERHGFRVEFCSYCNFLLFPLALARSLHERVWGRPDAQGSEIPGAAVPAKHVNAVLEGAFSSERHWLADARALPWGSSLIVWARKAP